MLVPEPAFISPSGGELIMVMLVLILLFGSKDAPRIFRSIQTFIDKVQRTASDFRYKMMYGDLQSETPEEAPMQPADVEPVDAPYDIEEDDHCDEAMFHEGEVPEEEEEEEISDDDTTEVTS